MIVQARARAQLVTCVCARNHATNHASLRLMLMLVYTVHHSGALKKPIRERLIS
jgi:hypothetical protein